jgi:hypothetical protein
VHFSLALLREYYSNIYGADYKKMVKKDDNFFYLTPKIRIPYARK